MKKFRLLLGLVAVAVVMVFTACNIAGGEKIDSTPQTGSITGKALYSNADDSTGIYVVLEKTDGLRSIAVINDARSIAGNTLVGKDGAFKFTNLEKGTYTVYASSNSSTEKAVAINVEVSEGKTTTVEDLKLTATGNISGSVILDGTSTGNEGFIVCVAGTSYMAVTDSNGKYTISGVPAGSTYTLYVMKGGQTWLMENVEVNVKANETSTVATVNFTSGGGDNGYESIDDRYNIECYATDRGIRFVTKILSNTYSNNYNNYASVEFCFTDNNNGIDMVRSWSKYYNNWTTCETFYPFVEAGKTYSFTITASKSDYTLYRKTVEITAIGGLGEFKIENTDKYDVTLTEDRVIKFTDKPVFTDNPKVSILRQANFYEFYEADDGAWNWIYNQESWLDNTDGTLSLKDSSDGISKWKSFETIDACLSGHKYRAIGRTYITVAGYQDNGQTYFRMNDRKEEVKDWGGEILQIPVIISATPDLLEGLPGDTYTIPANGAKINYFMKNYNTVLYEPYEVPTAKNALTSVFKGWEWIFSTNNYTSSQYPVTITPSLNNDEEENYLDFEGKKYYTYMMLIPSVDATYSVTLMDGDEKLEGDYIAAVEDVGVYGKASTEVSYNFTLNIEPKKEGYAFGGYYTDKELTQKAVSVTENDTVLYMKWTDIEKDTSEIGDIVLSNGKFINKEYYSSYKGSATPIGIVCKVNEDGTSGLMLGLSNSRAGTNSGSRQWAPYGTTGYNTKFTAIQGTPSGGDTDGSDNWAEICKVDPEGTKDPAINYPAFNYALTYAATAGLEGTEYAEGWYMPTVYELDKYVYRNKDVLNASLSAAGGTTLASYYYWSSSQDNTNYYCARKVNFGIGSLYGWGSKDDDISVCCLRAF